LRGLPIHEPILFCLVPGLPTHESDTLPLLEDCQSLRSFSGEAACVRKL